MKRIFVLGLALAVCVGSVGAQSLLDMLRGSSKTAAPATVGKINRDALVGEWKYSGAAVEFTGTDMVSVLAGSMAAPYIKQSLEAYFAKSGVAPGSCTVEFRSDDKYVARHTKEQLNGAYVFDYKAQRIKITYNHKFLGGEGSVDARLKFTGDRLQITLEADRIVAIIREITKDRQLDQNTKDLIDIISEYKGLYLGVELDK